MGEWEKGGKLGETSSSQYYFFLSRFPSSAAHHTSLHIRKLPMNRKFEEDEEDEDFGEEIKKGVISWLGIFCDWKKILVSFLVRSRAKRNQCIVETLFQKVFVSGGGGRSTDIQLQGRDTLLPTGPVSYVVFK